MAALWEQCIRLSNSQTSGQQTKDQEWLRSCLVLHIILDGIWNEVFVLEEDLQHEDAAGEDCRRADCEFIAENLTQEHGHAGMTQNLVTTQRATDTIGIAKCLLVVI